MTTAITETKLLKGSTAIKFLTRLCPAPWVLTAIEPDGDSTITQTFTDPEEARQFIAERNHKSNIYYSVNGTKRPLSSKAKKADIAFVRYLHVDADPGSAESPTSLQRVHGAAT
jgi:hypothetical protein